MSELADCPNKAEYIYPWSGKLMHACHQHTNAMRAVAQAIGAVFSAEPLVNGMMCQHKDDLEEEPDELAKKA